MVIQMVLVIITTALYIAAFALNWLYLMKREKTYQYANAVFAIGALLLHAYLLYQWIDIAGGQNLSSYTLLSVLIWLICGLIQILSFSQPITHLLLFGFPLSVLSIWLAFYFPGHHVVNTGADVRDLVHVLTAIFAFAVLCVAALQAVSLAWLHYRLRSRPPSILAQTLPPLEEMERSMFLLMAVGFILLTLLVVTSLYFFYGSLFTTFLRKMLLTFVAWLIFASLLLGRYGFGWRGRKAIYGTLSGIVVLTVVYFCSGLLMELLP